MFSFRKTCACICIFLILYIYNMYQCISVSVSFVSLFLSHYPLTLLVPDLNVSLILAPACRQGCPTMIVLIWQGLTYTWFNPSCLYRVCCGTSLFHCLGQGLVTAAVSPLCYCICEGKKRSRKLWTQLREFMHVCLMGNSPHRQQELILKRHHLIKWNPQSFKLTVCELKKNIFLLCSSAMKAVWLKKTLKNIICSNNKVLNEWLVFVCMSGCNNSKE